MAIFGYSKAQVTQAQREAQWDIVKRFKTSARYGEGHKRGREALIGLADPLIARDPERWISLLVARLAELIGNLEKRASTAESDLNTQKYRCEYLQRQLYEYQVNPLNERVDRLTEERDRYHEEMVRLRERVQRLEEALDRSQTAHQAEAERLNSRIAELERIIVDQEQRLDAFRN